ncbi:MAG TPA: DUF72 domain-containing protein [Bdellovibrionales bacterium]|nr:DUF72 domain-containing protein [Bdellovibrionales bacterium]
MNEIRVGISGWTYPGWKKTFYPKEISTAHELEYASHHFPTIELNGSFYRLQSPKVYRSWYDRTPDDFVFSVKGSRYITHTRRLRDIEAPLTTFMDSGVLELEEKLGPILWQFPPSMKFEPSLFRDFFEMLPKSSRKAKLRYAVEVRNDSFDDSEFFALLKEFGIALVIADTAGRWFQTDKITSDFVYIRLHGYKEMYSGGYPPKAIRNWANQIRRWGRGRDVFVYFDNDAKVNAPFDATSLMRALKDSHKLTLPEADLTELMRRRRGVGKNALRALQPRAQERR